MASQYKLIRIYCNEAMCDMLIAEMSAIGYDSFVYETFGFSASIPLAQFDEEKLKSRFHDYRSMGDIYYDTEDQEEKNWNEIWEKNYAPVIIGNQCIIRASFHEIHNPYPIDIMIDPKMSFGTGHHETTHLMILNQLETDHKDKIVLDVGCGTGILSILAEKLGAIKITGIDIDPWSFENAYENLQLNHSERIQILNEDISHFYESVNYDIILANINRQIILENMKNYSSLLNDQGILICSGFLIEDKEMIVREAARKQLVYDRQKTMNKWSSLVFQKKTN